MAYKIKQKIKEKEAKDMTYNIVQRTIRLENEAQKVYGSHYNDLTAEEQSKIRKRFGED